MTVGEEEDAKFIFTKLPSRLPKTERAALQKAISLTPGQTIRGLGHKFPSQTRVFPDATIHRSMHQDNRADRQWRLSGLRLPDPMRPIDIHPDIDHITVRTDSPG
jgi:hypothetical protein